MAINQPHQQGGEEWTRAYDERGVGGRGKVHRLIFAQEVERAARDAEQRHLALVLPRASEEVAMVHAEHQDVCDGKSKGENLRWRQAMEHEHLGGNEGGSPDGDGDERHEMI